jgi:hypothetical protein
MCEGWSLEIGIAFRGSVVRRDIGPPADDMDRVDKFNWAW